MGEYATVKTSVWWDIENCGVPRGCDAERIVQNMSSALATAGYRGPISVSAYGDTGCIGNRVQHALSSTGVTLNHVPAGIKDASDKRILVDMLFWAIDNPPPANYLLISGDRDFSNAIHKLKMRRYNILLAQPPNVSQTLSGAANSIWLWKSLVAGEPPLAQSPYISSTSSRNIDDIDISKNIVSNSLDVTPHTNPQMQDSLLCDHQSDSNGNSDKQCKVNQPRENQSDRVFKTASKKDRKRSNSVDVGSTTQPALKKAKKSKGGSCTAEHSKPPMLVPQNSRPVPGQGLICFKCGSKHHASGCKFIGDCQYCGAHGHKSRVCKRNPDCIVKWEPYSPKPAHIHAASSPGPVHILAVPPASQFPPAASSPSSVHMMAAAPASQSPPAMSSPGSVHVMAADPASKPPMLVPQNSRPVPGQGLICFKCGSKHHVSGCKFIGDCQYCGAHGHKSRVCKRNPDCIIKWEPYSPKPAHIHAASSPGPVHILAVPPASQFPPAASSPSSVQMMAAAPASQSPPAMSSPGSVHVMAADPASRLSPAVSSPGSIHMTATLLASELSSAASPPGSVHSSVFAMPTTAPLGSNVVTLPTSSAPCPPMIVSSLLCFKCGGGHSATGCTWAGACRHCGQQGHMGRVCRENPDSIIKWEPAPSHGLSAASQARSHGLSTASQARSHGLSAASQAPSHGLSAASQAPSHGLSAASQVPVHMMPGFPNSQLPSGWMSSPGWFWQAAFAMRPPLPGLPLAFAPPQPGAAVSFAPAHSGVYALPTPTSLGRPDMVADGNTSGSEPLPPHRAPHG